jgi:hypothetical protein
MPGGRFRAARDRSPLGFGGPDLITELPRETSRASLKERHMPRAALLRSILAGGFAAAGLLAASAPATAQSSSCQDAQKFLKERQDLIQQINKLGGKDKKIDPRAACSVMGKLVANGEVGVKWLDANKDWCQVPDAFAKNFRQDHDRSKEMRGQACKAAAQLNALEKKAKQAQQQQRGNPFGGGLTGEYKIPQGAL